MNCNEPPEGPPIDWDSVQIIAKACAKSGIYSPAWFPETFSLWWINRLIKDEEETLAALEAMKNE